MSKQVYINSRKAASESKITSLKDAVSSLKQVTSSSGMCIYVTGSYGRLEASEYSDLDLFFVQRSADGEGAMSHLDEILMKAELITKCRELGYPEFSGDGEYLVVHDLTVMREHLGGPKDDYENLFTARLLLLLESLPIYNEHLYGEVLRDITESYFRDYEDHEDDFQTTFLVNDILRFWKTLCLNYEHSRNKRPTDNNEIAKSHIKNLKLKFSRMLTCFSMVIPLAAPRTSMEPEECDRLIRERPLDRLNSIAKTSGNADLWDELADDYSWFLSVTGQPRDEVIKWIESKSDREQAFGRAKQFGDNMYRLLDKVADHETLRYLVI